LTATISLLKLEIYLTKLRSLLVTWGFLRPKKRAGSLSLDSGLRAPLSVDSRQLPYRIGEH
jgi:hypothetical protein